MRQEHAKSSNRPIKKLHYLIKWKKLTIILLHIWDYSISLASGFQDLIFYLKMTHNFYDKFAFLISLTLEYLLNWFFFKK